MTPTNRNKHLRSNIALLLGLGVLIAIAAWCGYKLDYFAKQQQRLKQDYSVVNSITFGIFSVDSWRDKISGVVDSQVNAFHVTKKQKRELQAQVEAQLHSLVAKTANEINKPQKSLGGKLKKLAFNAMVDVDTIQALVPSFAHTIVSRLTSPTSTKRLKGIVNGKLQQLEQQTYDSTAEAYHTLTQDMYKKYHVTDVDKLNKTLDSEVTAVHRISYQYAYAMFACVLIALASWWLLRKQVHLQTMLFVLSVLLALVLLIVGITAPIIEVDARIATMHFELLGQKVGFANQVIFFQSKSLTGIVSTLISQPKPDAVLVGVLILLFVIVLPVLMLVATAFHVAGSPKVAGNGVVKYLALESGKWNMADVMVVGILMTYIGLNGILKSQLSGLNMHGGGLTLVTTNNSYLQPGYLVFVAYVIYETVLRKILKHITATKG
ncbi:MAG: paraquat-inducible protein A [Bacteroidota bacterium]